MGEVGGVAVQAADAAGCQQGMLGRSCLHSAVLLADNGAIAAVVGAKQIQQHGMLQQCDMGRFFASCKRQLVMAFPVWS